MTISHTELARMAKRWVLSDDAVHLLEYKHNLAQYWAGLERVRVRVNIKSFIVKMKIPSGPHNLQMRRAMNIFIDLEEAGVGHFHGPSPKVEDERKSRIMELEAAFLFPKDFPLRDFAILALAEMGSDRPDSTVVVHSPCKRKVLGSNPSPGSVGANEER